MQAYQCPRHCVTKVDCAPVDSETTNGSFQIWQVFLIDTTTYRDWRRSEAPAVKPPREGEAAEQLRAAGATLAAWRCRLLALGATLGREREPAGGLEGRLGRRLGSRWPKGRLGSRWRKGRLGILWRRAPLISGYRRLEPRLHRRERRRLQWCHRWTHVHHRHKGIVAELAWHAH